MSSALGSLTGRLCVGRMAPAIGLCLSARSSAAARLRAHSTAAQVDAHIGSAVVVNLQAPELAIRSVGSGRTYTSNHDDCDRSAAASPMSDHQKAADPGRSSGTASVRSNGLDERPADAQQGKVGKRAGASKPPNLAPRPPATPVRAPIPSGQHKDATAPQMGPRLRDLVTDRPRDNLPPTRGPPVSTTNTICLRIMAGLSLQCHLTPNSVGNPRPEPRTADLAPGMCFQAQSKLLAILPGSISGPAGRPDDQDALVAPRRLPFPRDPRSTVYWQAELPTKATSGAAGGPW